MTSLATTVRSHGNAPNIEFSHVSFWVWNDGNSQNQTLTIGRLFQSCMSNYSPQEKLEHSESGLGPNTYSYLYLYSNTQMFVFVFVFEKNQIGVFVFVLVFERCIWKIFFKYSSNFKRISAELNNISSVACSMLPLTNCIMTHSHCKVKFPITAWICSTNDWDELLTMTLFKFVLPDLCLLQVLFSLIF